MIDAMTLLTKRPINDLPPPDHRIILGSGDTSVSAYMGRQTASALSTGTTPDSMISMGFSCGQSSCASHQTASGQISPASR
jgi:hypothetical protein